MKRILIVEDDKSIAQLEKDYLEVNGFEVDMAYDGETGLSKAMNADYDLLLLDLMLPGKDGFEICKQLRSEKDMPILMVTARKEDIDKIKGFGAGADDYIVKPFSPGELVARVKAHLERYERLTKKSASGKETNTEKEIVAGNLRIQPEAWRVFVGEKEVKLTNKEFELLLFLASNPNIVFDKEKLFDRIWGMDSFGDTATVTVHINRIREKIEDDSTNSKYIETIWGAGYRFKL
ncbi:MAG: response regulator transcription factor [Clostridia bacterium]|nr:response regulator transcription factor [Clostridia bacterium]